MTTRTATYRCRHCHRTFTRRSSKGRPPTYCKSACRSAAYRARTTPTATLPARDPQVARIGEDVVAHARRLGLLVRATHTPSPLDVLQQLAALYREIEDFTAVAVRQARTSGVAWAIIAEPLQMTADTARTRWSAEKVARQMDKRRKRTAASPPPPPGDQPTRGMRTVPRQRSTRAGTDRAPSTGSPPRRSTSLSTALASLHQSSGKSLRGLAREAGISASFASRVLSGERLPSWGITEDIALACGTDPATLRPLWDQARTEQPTTAARTSAPEQTMPHLAAHPAPTDGHDLLRLATALRRHHDADQHPHLTGGLIHHDHPMPALERAAPALPAAAFG